MLFAAYYLLGIDNLPAELSYHLAELKAKEIKYQGSSLIQPVVQHMTPAEILLRLLTFIHRFMCGFTDVRMAIIRREGLLASYIKEHGLQNSQQYESIMNTKTKRDFAQARQLADEKITLSDQTLELVSSRLPLIEVAIRLKPEE
jgi:hypothetical protein